MEIRYSKRRLISIFILAGLFIAFGGYFIWTYGLLKFSSIAYTSIGLSYLGIGLYLQKAKYMKIKDDRIRMFSLLKKKVYLKDITEVYIKFGDYFIETPQHKLVLKKDFIHEDDRDKLEDYFKELQSELDKRQKT